MSDVVSPAAPTEPRGLTQEQLLRMFDVTAAYPEIRAAIRRVLVPPQPTPAEPEKEKA